MRRAVLVIRECALLHLGGGGTVILTPRKTKRIEMFAETSQTVVAI